MSRDEGRDGGRDEDTDETQGPTTGAPDGTGDAAFDRLRAADPAAGVGTPAGLRASVDGRLAEEGPIAVPRAAGTAARDEVAVDEHVADELAARRRRRPWLAVAAVAAFAVVGGGGYLLGGGAVAAGGAGDESGGASSSVDSEAASTAEAPVALGGGAPGGPGGAQEGTAGRGAAADASGGAVPGSAGDSAGSMTSTAGDAMPSWYDSGRATFHADGMSTDGGSAEAYAFDATDVATRAGAARLADALGVAGKPRWEYGAWAAGPRDGDGPTIWLSVDGSATFSYNDPDADPWRCEDVARTTEDGGAAADDDGDGCADRHAEPVGDRAARRALTDIMTRLGVDPSGFEIEVAKQTDDEPGRWVTAFQVVGGSRTGAQWSATVGPDGVAWLDGFLAATTDLGEYPVISAAEAVDRLGDPRFAGSAWPVVYSEEAEYAEPDEPAEPTAPPAPPAAGDKVDWPVSDVEITDARLGLALQTQTDGAVALVPAYELSDADGNAWSVLAVADAATDYSTPR